MKAITYQSENISTSRFQCFLPSICFVCISLFVCVSLCVCVCLCVCVSVCVFGVCERARESEPAYVCVWERERERQICYHELKCKSCCRVWNISSGVLDTKRNNYFLNLKYRIISDSKWVIFRWHYVEGEIMDRKYMVRKSFFSRAPYVERTPVGCFVAKQNICSTWRTTKHVERRQHLMLLSVTASTIAIFG